MSENHGGPAFPRRAFVAPDFARALTHHGQEGMSLRDYFAGQVLAGSQSRRNPEDCYEIADAMLRARASDGQPEKERALVSELLQAAEGLMAACQHHGIHTGTMDYAKEIIQKAMAAGVR